MSRYDGLIIPRSYSEYINKTDAATLSQALQLAGVLAQQVTAGNNAAVTSNAVNNAFNNLNVFRYATVRSATDIDTIVENTQARFYFQIYSADSRGTAPAGVNSMAVATMRWDGNYGVQIGYEMTQYHRMYIRYYNNGTWGEWEKIIQQHNLTDYIQTVRVTFNDFTIPSTGYVALGQIIPATDTRKIIGQSVYRWTSNTGAFNIIAYYNGLAYALGTPNVQVKGLIMDFYVM